MTQGIYESCKAVVEPDNMEALLVCATTYMELAQKNAWHNVTSYLLVLSGALVFFMQAGFAMLCAGSVRKKNTQNTMLKNLLDACGAAIAFFCVGYAFAFGGDGDGTSTTFIGNANFFGMDDINLPFYFFQYTFAAASVTIVAGALAERCQMAAYLCYSFFLTGFVYPVAVHSVWSSRGFLSAGNADPLLGIGMVDFAGSGVVHMTGGTTALIATYLLGSRRGRFYDLQTGEPLEEPKPMPGHSVSLQILGAFILWFGWFGFNPGSALLLSDENPYRMDVAALCAVNTFLASSGGCISALMYKVITVKHKTGEAAFDLIVAMNGTLSGLVAITAGCGTVEPWAALVIGIISGFVYLWGSNVLVFWKLDDVVDAAPVHFFNGFWGCIATGLFSHPERMRQAYGTDQFPGFFYSLTQGNPSGHLLACQILGSLFIIGWALVTMTPFFLALNTFGWLRTEAVEELVGLDVCYNGEQLTNMVNGEMGSKAGSDGDELMRGEFLDAYEDYRRQQQENKARGASSPPPRAGSRTNIGMSNNSFRNHYTMRGSQNTDNSSGSVEDFDETQSV